MAVGAGPTAASLDELMQADPVGDEVLPEPLEDESLASDASGVDEPRADAVGGEGAAHRRWRPAMLTTGATVVSMALVTLAALAGWLGWQLTQARDAQQHRDVVLQVGRQAAINLTSIDHATVDADIQRVLDGSVGTFHDEFQTNAAEFATVVRQSQTTTHGSVTEAGVESIDGDTAAVLVTASVDTSSAGAGVQSPRVWRMRITVAQTPAGARVSNVAFVP